MDGLMYSTLLTATAVEDEMATLKRSCRLSIVNIVYVRPSFSLVENVPRESPQKSLRNPMAEPLRADMQAGGRCGCRLRMWKNSPEPPSQMP
jgi:hypothetical protein